MKNPLRYLNARRIFVKILRSEHDIREFCEKFQRVPDDKDLS